MKLPNVSQLDKPGDLCAEPGSEPWAIAARRELQKLVKVSESDHERLSFYVQSFQETKGYRALLDKAGRPFRSWEAFCTAPYPWGLGYRTADIDRIIAERKARTVAELAADPEVKPLAEPNTTGRNNPTVDNINGRPTGTSVSCLVRRLKRDAPDTAKALARGEYPSARAAGIAAGIVKVPTPLEAARKACAKLSARERRELIDWLQSLVPE
jgi:hypothetical protein